ncbi:hypothetical protein [Vibrio sp. 10N.261.54.E10]|uniref:hypothetical protein n=1 Tax=Vibrio sp. 10N.261.54.E10 TaxID=1884475 RepID=UPI0039A630AD
MWRAGCIIRAAFLQSITSAYQQNAELANLLFDEGFSSNKWKSASLLDASR